MIVRQGEDPNTPGRLYVTVVESVLMIISETWVVMLSILRTMGSLYNQTTQHISDRMPLRLNNEGWDYPPDWGRTGGRGSGDDWRLCGYLVWGWGRIRDIGRQYGDRIVA